MAKNWFEATVRYERALDNGIIKKVSEKYLLDAVNPTEAETRITELIAPLSVGEFSVKSIVEQSYQEFISSDAINADYFFCATLEFITLDERTGKEKKSAHRVLIQAIGFHDAVNRLVNEMKNSIVDYSIVKIERTKLIDVYTK